MYFSFHAEVAFQKHSPPRNKTENCSGELVSFSYVIELKKCDKGFEITPLLFVATCACQGFLSPLYLSTSIQIFMVRLVLPEGFDSNVS